jgi:hypothetical protein
MDAASVDVASFLSAGQDRIEQLRQLRQDFMAAGATNASVTFNLSGRPFNVHQAGSVIEYRGCLALGLIVHAADGREFDLGVDLLWSDEAWLIDTEAWVGNDDGGQDLLERLPHRTAVDLPSCLRHLQAAVGDLARFRSHVFGAA